MTDIDDFVSKIGRVLAVYKSNNIYLRIDEEYDMWERIIEKLVLIEWNHVAIFSECDFLPDKLVKMVFRMCGNQLHIGVPVLDVSMAMRLSFCDEWIHKDVCLKTSAKNTSFV